MMSYCTIFETLGLRVSGVSMLLTANKSFTISFFICTNDNNPVLPLVVLFREIKTSPLLLPRWPIRNLCLQHRSCLLATTSTSTSTSPGNEPLAAPDHHGPPARGQDHTTPNTCSGCQGSLAVKHSLRPLPPSVCACKCLVSTSIMTNVPFLVSYL